MNIKFVLKSTESTKPYVRQKTDYTVPVVGVDNSKSFELKFCCDERAIYGECLGSEDPYGRVNAMRRLVEDVLNGHWLSCDVVSFLSIDRFEFMGKVCVYSGQNRPLAEFRETGQPILVDEKFSDIIGSEAGWYLSNAIRSYKYALTDAFDGPMHIYRAIEVIRQFYKVQLDPLIKENHRDGKSWELLRARLGVTKELIQRYSHVMVPSRHGAFLHVSKEDYRLMLGVSHEIINKFLTCEMRRA